MLADSITAGSPTGGLLLRARRREDQRPGPWLAATLGAAPADPRTWFALEHHALVASVERAAAMDLDQIASELASALCASLFAVKNMFEARARTHDAAFAAVRRAGNRSAEAVLLAEFGQLRYKQDRLAQARTYLMRALDVFRELGDARGEAATLAALATANHEQGYLPEALHFFELADTVFHDLRDDAAVAYTARLVGLIHLEQGDLRVARERVATALNTFRRLGSRPAARR